MYFCKLNCLMDLCSCIQFWKLGKSLFCLGAGNTGCLVVERLQNWFDLWTGLTFIRTELLHPDVMLLELPFWNPLLFSFLPVCCLDPRSCDILPAPLSWGFLSVVRVLWNTYCYAEPSSYTWLTGAVLAQNPLWWVSFSSGRKQVCSLWIPNTWRGQSNITVFLWNL